MSQADELEPGELYLINREVYDPEVLGEKRREGLWFPQAHYLEADPAEDTPTLWGSQTGMYLGTQRVSEPWQRRKKHGGSTTVRRLVHVFLWSGDKVVLSPEWVMPV
jgi:hypothetical protein|tara:strand:- start:1819 stop:2139 length:321 start_codon:yes stop_codon:yes gene_type:complete